MTLYQRDHAQGALTNSRHANLHPRAPETVSCLTHWCRLTHREQACPLATSGGHDAVPATKRLGEMRGLAVADEQRDLPDGQRLTRDQLGVRRCHSEKL